MKSNPEINAFKHRIRELEAISVHHKAREEQLVDMLHPFVDITEQEKDE